jgi:hypothetical protein
MLRLSNEAKRMEKAARNRWSTIAVLCCLMFAGAVRAEGPPNNPYLLAAKRLYAALDYEAALGQLSRAAAMPGASVGDQVEIQIYTGLVKFELGEPETGREAFRQALALDPHAVLPADVSPKIQAEWSGVRKELAEIEPQVSTAPSTAGAGQSDAGLDIVGDAGPPSAVPSALDAGGVGPPLLVEPVTDAGPANTAALAQAPSSVDVPPATVDAHAAQKSLAVASPLPRDTAGGLTRTQPGPSDWTRPLFLLGGAAVIAAGGAALGYSAQSERNQAAADPVQFSAANTELDAQHRALAANIVYGVAGAAAVASAIWFFAQ